MDSRALRRRGVALLMFGVALPPLAFLAAAVLVNPPPGMDGYVPGFIGGLVGAIVGAVLFVRGVGRLVEARRQDKIASELAK